MVKRRFLCSLLCCSPCCAVLALVGANTRFVGANAMFATFAPRILWFAQRNLWFAPPNAVSLCGFFLKSPRPSLPLKRAPPLSPSPFPLRGQGMCQPPYSVLKPLRYKVGGPSEVFASSGAAVCGMRPQGYERAKELQKAQKPIAARPNGQEAHGSSTP